MIILEAAFVELLVLCGVSAGLLTLGGTWAVLARRSPAARLGASVGGVAVAAAIPAVAGHADVSHVSGLVVGLAGLLAFGTGLLRRGSVVRLAARPRLQGGLLAGVGGALLVAGMSRFDAADEEITDTDQTLMGEAVWRPALEPAAGPGVLTDAGRPIALFALVTPRPADQVVASEDRVMGTLSLPARPTRLAPADETTNCHGWVFTGGRYWLTPEDVQMILADNGYERVSQPRSGDLVVYRIGGAVTHTAVVESAGDGPVMVESKWGWMGVFRHQPGASCYGTEYTFYRSPRDGHLLVGLGGRPSETRPAVSTGEFTSTVMNP